MINSTHQEPQEDWYADRRKPSSIKSHLKEVAKGGEIKMYESEEVIAIHLLPDDMPVPRKGTLVYIAYEGLTPGKTLFVFAGNSQGDHFDHEGIAGMLSALDIIPNTVNPVGGGHMRVPEYTIERSSISFGKVDDREVDYFVDLISDREIGIFPSGQRNRHH